MLSQVPSSFQSLSFHETREFCDTTHLGNAILPKLPRIHSPVTLERLVRFLTQRLIPSGALSCI